MAAACEIRVIDYGRLFGFACLSADVVSIVKRKGFDRDGDLGTVLFSEAYFILVAIKFQKGGSGRKLSID